MCIRDSGGIHESYCTDGRHYHNPGGRAAWIFGHSGSRHVPEHTAGFEKGSPARVCESGAQEVEVCWREAEHTAHVRGITVVLNRFDELKRRVTAGKRIGRCHSKGGAYASQKDEWTERSVVALGFTRHRTPVYNGAGIGPVWRQGRRMADLQRGSSGHEVPAPGPDQRNQL